MEESSVSVAGVNLAVAEAGRGGAPLLFVHGFTGAKEDIADHAERLVELGYHVVAPDLRGHGSSDKPDAEADYSIARFGEDVLAVADAFGFTRFSLMGHSMGGMIAQWLALEAPDRLERLVLLDTSPGRPDFGRPMRALGRVGRMLVPRTGLGVVAWLTGLMDERLSPPSVKDLYERRPELLQTGIDKILQSSPAMWTALNREILALPDLTARLRAVKIPTMVMVGAEDDPFIRPAVRLAAAIPKATLSVIPGAAHSPQFESPEEFWSALAEFLRLDRLLPSSASSGASA